MPFALLSTLATATFAAPQGPSPEPPPGACEGITLQQAILGGARPIWPLSTSRVTGRAPTVTWSTCAPRVEVQLCLDHGCEWVLEDVLVDHASSYTQPQDLPVEGPVFWRVRPLSQQETSTLYGPWSPAWEMMLPATSAPHFGVGGSVYDVDLDGLVDFVLNVSTSDETVHVYSTALGIPSTPDGSIATSPNGNAFTSAGDMDGDGYPELLVRNGDTVEVFPGGPTGPAPDPTILVTGVVTFWGDDCIGGAGDLNGDGYADVVVHAGDHRLQIWLGGRGRLRSGEGPDLVLYGDQEKVLPGGVCAGVGDLNGDGYADLASGGDNDVLGLWYGGPKGPVDADLVEVQGFAHAWFDRTLSDPADVDGDGYYDIVAATEGAPNVWAGGPAGVFPWWPTWVFEWPGKIFAFSMSHVSASGDLNGDGLDDVVVNGQLADEVYVYLSKDGAPRTDPTFTLSGASTEGWVGAGGVKIVGDLDDNGFDDLLAGVGDDGSNPPDGWAWLLPSDGTPTAGEGLVLETEGPTHVGQR